MADRKKITIEIDVETQGARQGSQEAKARIKEIGDVAKKVAGERKTTEADLNKEVEKLLKETTRMAAKEAAERSRNEERELRQQAQLNQRIRNEEYRENTRRLRAVEAEAKKFEQDQVKGFSFVSSAAGQFKAVLGSIGGQFALLSVGTKMVDAITDSWAKAAEQTREAVKSNLTYRDSLLEIAALKGRLGDTTAEGFDQIKFRQKTLQKEGDAIAFGGEVRNVGNVNVGKSISKEEFDKLMVLGGKFQAAEGGDAATHGKITGLIPAMMSKKTGITAVEAAAEEQKMFNIMQMGGFSFSSGAKQIIDKQGYVKSGVLSTGVEEAALLSALSNETNPDEAGTRLTQMIDATTGHLRRATEGRMDGETEGASKYLKRLGATDQMHPQDIMKLISADWGNQRAEAKRSGKEFNPITYMQGHGYQGVEAIQSMMAFEGSVSSGRWTDYEKRIGTATGLLPEDEKAEGFKSAARRMAEFEHADPVAKKRRADLDKRAAEMGKALPAESYNTLEEQTFRLMQQKGTATGEYEDWKTSYTGMFAGAGAPSKSRMHDEMMRVAVEAAKKAGINARVSTDNGVSRYDFEGIGSYRYSPVAGEDRRASAIGEIEAGLASKGVNLSAELTKRTNDLLERIVKATEERTAKAASGTPPLTAEPPAAPIR